MQAAFFVSTEGADIAQTLTECGGGIGAEATGEGELQIQASSQRVPALHLASFSFTGVTAH